MTSITYEEIFNNFLGSITDYDLQENLSVSDSEQLMTEYLHKAFAEPHVARLFGEFTLDDATHTVSYETDVVMSEDFVTTAIAKWMVYEWLHKQVRSVSLTMPFLGTKEQKFYSFSSHLAELRALQADAFKEAKDLLVQRGYIDNEYLNGGT